MDPLASTYRLREGETKVTRYPSDPVRVFRYGKDSTDEFEDADLLYGGQPDPCGRVARGRHDAMSRRGRRHVASLVSSGPGRRSDRPSHRDGRYLAVESLVTSVPASAGGSRRGPARVMPGPLHRAVDRGRSGVDEEAGDHDGPDDPRLRTREDGLGPARPEVTAVRRRDGPRLAGRRRQAGTNCAP